MMHEAIYKLSSDYSPPKVDLRQAQIADDYGDESFSQHKIEHKKPCDVKREDFDHYTWVYSFVEPTDLIFYLYPILLEYERDNDIEAIAPFMYSMDSNIDKLRRTLNESQLAILKEALNKIWELGYYDDDNEWYQCKKIQEFLGV